MADLDHLTPVERYRADIDRVNAAMPEEAKDRLRAVRLWHWRRALASRQLEQDSQRSGLNALADHHKQQADQSISFVQALNDFFEAGDTAELDAATRTANKVADIESLASNRRL